MEFFDVINKRRAVRNFTAEAVPESVVNKAIDAALIAPNSSNMQAWEFYWVRSAEKKSKLVEACFSQGSARTAAELIVAVSRVDTWKRNRNLILESAAKRGPVPAATQTYYSKVVPASYAQDPFGILGIFKKVLFTIVGMFRPSPRSPAFRYELFEVVSKSAALACQNLMLSIVDQGYACCPMEGFDERRVKKLLALNSKCHVVMVVGLGRADPSGVWGDRFRVDRSLVVKEV